MKQENRISRLVTKVKSFPMGGKLLNLLMGRMIPFVGTSGLEILEMTENRLVVRIENRRKIRNHIGQVHAAAMILLGETASGLLVGMNVSDECLPLIKEMNSKFIKRSQGAMTATATIRPEDRALFQSEKGEIPVIVEVRDEVGEEPILIQTIWAWVPKKKKE